MKDKLISLLDVFDFGKYKGKTIQDVLDDNVLYVEWCINNIEWFELDEEATEYYEEQLYLFDCDNPYPSPYHGDN